MKEGMVLLEIAKKDLEASRLLYENELYPQALFYLEQAIEKVFKGLSVALEIITLDEAKKISHTPFQWFIIVQEKYIENVEKIESLLMILSTSHPIPVWSYEEKTKLSEISKKIKKWDKEARKLSGSEELLEEFISEYEEIGNQLEQLREISPEERQNIIGEVLESEIKKLYYGYKLPYFVTVTFAYHTKAMLEFLFGNIELIIKPLSLIWCSLFLFIPLYPVVSMVRYPIGSHNPLEVYDENHPLIKKFDLLYQKIEEILIEIERYLREEVVHALQ